MATVKPTQVKPTQKDIDENKMMAALSYFSVLCLVPLLLKKDSPYTQFHAKQGLAIFIVEAIAVLVSMTIILAWLSTIVMVVCLIASIYGMYLALNGKMESIPGLEKIIKKLNV